MGRDEARGLKQVMVSSVANVSRHFPVGSVQTCVTHLVHPHTSHARSWQALRTLVEPIQPLASLLLLASWGSCAGSTADCQQLLDILMPDGQVCYIWLVAPRHTGRAVAAADRDVLDAARAVTRRMYTRDGPIHSHRPTMTRPWRTRAAGWRTSTAWRRGAHSSLASSRSSPRQCFGGSCASGRCWRSSATASPQWTRSRCWNCSKPNQCRT